MEFLGHNQLVMLDGDLQQHLTQLEDAVQDALLASAVAAKVNQLDVDLIAKATLPLVISVLAREYLELCEQAECEPEQAEFTQLADAAYTWASSRKYSDKKTRH